ncbi:MAG: indole-3-glycerol phosphate synthase TrpC [Candidatus Tectomicrobia bacterium]|uniref:Indole-3-glycerol phosphate synthase n=1 Tax=Tectimicrobiota bacterium TaxID=2528274 RepID=A0A933GJ78_UNCTE|nr:indole-3-glycerol phosphate synthase TrpC [Candidatus Tectomicrobia bacterium]
MILQKIVDKKKITLEEEKKALPLVILKEEIEKRERPRSLKRSLAESGTTNIIAEIKQASPSLGIIRQEGFDPVGLADLYEKNGAKAISVITEKSFFLGDLEYLKNVKRKTGLPVLRKDFLWDEYQLYQSRAFGADAILLIAAILELERLRELLNLAAELGMEVLLEVHDERELDLVLKTNSEIIGINNRNLKTFQVTLDTTQRLMALIPKEKTIVSESGIKGRADILTLEQYGVKAFLVGETLMRAPDTGRALRELIGLQR